MTITQLSQRLREKIPVGVDFEIGKLSDKTTWRAAGGTAELRAAAQAIIDAFDPAQEQAAVEAEEKAAIENAELMKTLPEKYKALQAAYDSLSAQLSSVKLDVATLKAAK